jgi:hypothetical protein
MIDGRQQYAIATAIEGKIDSRKQQSISKRIFQMDS